MAIADADIDKARKIVQKYHSFEGPMGSMRENIAKAVAEGIAAGRREGLETAISITKIELEKQQPI